MFKYIRDVSVTAPAGGMVTCLSTVADITPARLDLHSGTHPGGCLTPPGRDVSPANSASA